MKALTRTILFALGLPLAPPAFGQGPPVGGAPPTAAARGGRVIVGGALPEIQLVTRFDKDGDQRLDAAERKAAREYLAANPQLRTGGAPRTGRSAGPATPGQKLSPADVKAYPGVPLFDSKTLRTVFLEFEDTDWEREMVEFYRTDVEVPAQLTVDGKSYLGVGVHFHGNNSFTAVPDGFKRSLTLSLDFVHPAQELEGYSGLHLLNANQDPTFVRSMLYLEVARDYLPAPKANFVRVVINGENWGVYVNQQAFNKDFLRDAFKTTKGTRWKSPNNSVGGGFRYLGEDVALYRRWYDIKSKDDPKAWSDLVRLCRVLHETPPDKLEKALAPLLDVNGALKFLALDNVLINNDGYWNDGSDFDIYQDEKGRFHLVPYDVNEGFRASGAGRGGRGVQLDPFATISDTNKALLHKLLAAPALRARYLGYIRDIAEKWLDWKKLGPIVAKYQALIAADVAADTRKLSSTADFTAGVFGADSGAAPPPSTLKGFADQRRAFLLSHPEVSKARRP
jgi:hypothetical protein